MRHQKFPRLALLAIVVLGVFASSAVAATAVEDDDAVVLPSRVANPIQRADLALIRAISYVDNGDRAKSVLALKAVLENLLRADKAARTQMAAAAVDPDAEDADTDTEEPEAPDAPEEPEGPDEPDAPDAPDAEDTEEAEELEPMGPDSVVAVLTLDSEIITNLAGLFDKKPAVIVNSVSPTFLGVMNARGALLDAVIALDPEGAGADYSDVMADIATNFDDEVANLTEALSDDVLSPGARNVLVRALAQSQQAQAKYTAAFGGGE